MYTNQAQQSNEQLLLQALLKNQGGQNFNNLGGGNFGGLGGGNAQRDKQQQIE